MWISNEDGTEPSKVNGNVRVLRSIREDLIEKRPIAYFRLAPPGLSWLIMGLLQPWMNKMGYSDQDVAQVGALVEVWFFQSVLIGWGSPYLRLNLALILSFTLFMLSHAILGTASYVDGKLTRAPPLSRQHWVNMIWIFGYAVMFTLPFAYLDFEKAFALVLFLHTIVTNRFLPLIGSPVGMVSPNGLLENSLIEEMAASKMVWHPAHGGEFIIRKLRTRREGTAKQITEYRIDPVGGENVRSAIDLELGINARKKTGHMVLMTSNLPPGSQTPSDLLALIQRDFSRGGLTMVIDNVLNPRMLSMARKLPGQLEVVITAKENGEPEYFRPWRILGDQPQRTIDVFSVYGQFAGQTLLTRDGDDFKLSASDFFRDSRDSFHLQIVGRGRDAMIVIRRDQPNWNDNAPGERLEYSIPLNEKNDGFSYLQDISLVHPYFGEQSYRLVSGANTFSLVQGIEFIVVKTEEGFRLKTPNESVLHEALTLTVNNKPYRVYFQRNGQRQFIAVENPSGGDTPPVIISQYLGSHYQRLDYRVTTPSQSHKFNGSNIALLLLSQFYRLSPVATYTTLVIVIVESLTLRWVTTFGINIFMTVAVVFFVFHLGLRLRLYLRSEISAWEVLFGSFNDALALSCYVVLPEGNYLPVLTHFLTDLLWIKKDQKGSIDDYFKRIDRIAANDRVKMSFDQWLKIAGDFNNSWNQYLQTDRVDSENIDQQYEDFGRINKRLLLRLDALIAEHPDQREQFLTDTINLHVRMNKNGGIMGVIGDVMALLFKDKKVDVDLVANVARRFRARTTLDLTEPRGNEINPQFLSKEILDGNALGAPLFDVEQAAELKKNHPALYNAVFFDANIREIVSFATFTRLIFFPFVKFKDGTTPPLAYANLNKLRFHLGKNIYMTPVTESFRRMAIYELSADGRAHRTVELKVPGLVRHKRLGAQGNYTFSRDLRRAYPKQPLTETPVALLEFSEPIQLYAINRLKGTSPVRIMVYSYDRDANRLTNIDLDGFCRSHGIDPEWGRREVARQVMSLRVSAHSLNIFAGLDAGLDNFRLTYGKKTGLHVYFAGDFGSYTYTSNGNYLWTEATQIAWDLIHILELPQLIYDELMRAYITDIHGSPSGKLSPSATSPLGVWLWRFLAIKKENGEIDLEKTAERAPRIESRIVLAVYSISIVALYFAVRGAFQLDQQAELFALTVTMIVLSLACSLVVNELFVLGHLFGNVIVADKNTGELFQQKGRLTFVQWLSIHSGSLKFHLIPLFALSVVAPLLVLTETDPTGVGSIFIYVFVALFGALTYGGMVDGHAEWNDEKRKKGGALATIATPPVRFETSIELNHNGPRGEISEAVRSGGIRVNAYAKENFAHMDSIALGIFLRLLPDIINNAIDAKAPTITIRAWMDDDTAHLEILSLGTGQIPPKTLEKIRSGKRLTTKILGATGGGYGWCFFFNYGTALSLGWRFNVENIPDGNGVRVSFAIPTRFTTKEHREPFTRSSQAVQTRIARAPHAYPPMHYAMDTLDAFLHTSRPKELLNVGLESFQLEERDRIRRLIGKIKDRLTTEELDIFENGFTKSTLEKSNKRRLSGYGPIMTFAAEENYPTVLITLIDQDVFPTLTDDDLLQMLTMQTHLMIADERHRQMNPERKTTPSLDELQRLATRATEETLKRTPSSRAVTAWPYRALTESTADFVIDWSKITVSQILNRPAQQTWLTTTPNGFYLSVTRTEKATIESNAAPGSILRVDADGGLTVQAADGPVKIFVTGIWTDEIAAGKFFWRSGRMLRTFSQESQSEKVLKGAPLDLHIDDIDGPKSYFNNNPVREFFGVMERARSLPYAFSLLKKIRRSLSEERREGHKEFKNGRNVAWDLRAGELARQIAFINEVLLNLSEDSGVALGQLADAIYPFSTAFKLARILMRKVELTPTEYNDPNFNEARHRVADLFKDLKIELKITRAPQGFKEPDRLLFMETVEKNEIVIHTTRKTLQRLASVEAPRLRKRAREIGVEITNSEARTLAFARMLIKEIGRHYHVSHYDSTAVGLAPDEHIEWQQQYNPDKDVDKFAVMPLSIEAMRDALAFVAPKALQSQGIREQQMNALRNMMKVGPIIKKYTKSKDARVFISHIGNTGIEMNGSNQLITGLSSVEAARKEDPAYLLANGNVAKWQSRVETYRLKHVNLLEAATLAIFDQKNSLLDFVDQASQRLSKKGANVSAFMGTRAEFDVRMKAYLAFLSSHTMKEQLRNAEKVYGEITTGKLALITSEKPILKKEDFDLNYYQSEFERLAGKPARVVIVSDWRAWAIENVVVIYNFCMLQKIGANVIATVLAAKQA